MIAIEALKRSRSGPLCRYPRLHCERGEGSKRPDEDNRILAESTGDEPQDLCGRPVQPLQIIGHDHARGVLGGQREQVKHRYADRERVEAGRTDVAVQEASKRFTKRLGQASDQLPKRPQQCGEARPEKLALGLDPGDLDDPESGVGRADGVSKQGRFAATRFTHKHDATTAAISCAGEGLVEKLLLIVAAEHERQHPLYPLAGA